MIKGIILEDETSAQELLKSYIDKTNFIECLGIFESALDIPLELIKATDVLFLDIQLPEISGLSFARTLRDSPKIIVTSAYPDYTLEAFEIAVSDYLLKPFSYERFLSSITRIREQISTRETVISLYADKTIHRVKISEIIYLKAEVDYVKFITEKQEILVLDSLKNWEEKLRHYNFIRIHRSYVVNSSKIDRITSHKVCLDKFELPVSQSYRDFSKNI